MRHNWEWQDFLNRMVQDSFAAAVRGEYAEVDPDEILA